MKLKGGAMMHIDEDHRLIGDRATFQEMLKREIDHEHDQDRQHVRLLLEDAPRQKKLWEMNYIEALEENRRQWSAWARRRQR